jgi:multimeric flavodoxin WrbA
MKITILNGSPEPSGFDDILKLLKIKLEDRQNSVTLINLRDITLRYCIGCWGCWVKTPGICSHNDESPFMDTAVINSDFVLWATPLIMGFPSELFKRAMDKHLPLIHPYILEDQGEMHHLGRYDQYPRLGLLLDPEYDTDENDLEVISTIFQRTALNFKSHLDFSMTTPKNVDDLIERILNPTTDPLSFPKPLAPIKGERITPPAKLTLFNGSPRGKRASTPLMLEQFAQGFGGKYEIHHLVYLNKMPEFVQAFQESDSVWLGFPLYTDAMPAITKRFIEALEPLAHRKNNPPIGFLVQSGFMEGLHSRYVERYLQALATRLGSPYLGTIVKGGGEGTFRMPAQATKPLFDKLKALGAEFSMKGELNPQILKKIANPERFPKVLMPVMRYFLSKPVSHNYFDNMLNENNAYEERFARPFSKA